MKKTRQIVTLITVFSFLLNSVPVYAVGDYNDSSSQDININSNLLF